MSDEELEKIIGTAQKFKTLRGAKAHVERLERELRAEPAKPDDSTFVSGFLRVRAGNGFANPINAHMPLLHD